MVAMFRREAGQCGNLRLMALTRVLRTCDEARRGEGGRGCGRRRCCLLQGCSIQTAPLGRQERSSSTANDRETGTNNRVQGGVPIITKKMSTVQTERAPQRVMRCSGCRRGSDGRVSW